MYKFPGFMFVYAPLGNTADRLQHIYRLCRGSDEKAISSDPITHGRLYGVSGIENYYEKYLRGEKGQEVMLVDVHGVVQGPYQGGRFDKDPVVGRNLVCTVDLDLQEYGELLMKNYKGSIVAIEPSKGSYYPWFRHRHSTLSLVGRERTIKLQ
jgi:penicillin-binding protein 2